MATGTQPKQPRGSKQKPAPETSDLESFLSEVARLTGLHVCLYDLNYFTQETPALDVSPNMRIHGSPFCLLVKSNIEAHTKCVETECFRAEEAGRGGVPFVHVCHAGITDLVLPIRYGQQTIGAIYLGQCITQPARNQAATLKRLSAKYGYDHHELQSLAANTPRLRTDELHGHATVMKLLQAYIEQTVALQMLRNRDATPTLPPSSTHAVNMEQLPTYELDQLRPQSAPIQKAVAILKHTYWTKIDLPQVAREVGLSQGHFSRQFRKETGLTFRECLGRARIAAAHYLLKKTELGTKEIARMLGYSATSNFVRAFKAFSYVTTQEYTHRQVYPVDTHWWDTVAGPAAAPEREDEE